MDVYAYAEISIITVSTYLILRINFFRHVQVIKLSALPYLSTKSRSEGTVFQKWDFVTFFTLLLSNFMQKIRKKTD